MDTELQEAWNEYWAKTLEDEFWRSASLIGLRSRACLEHLDFFRKRNVRRILLPGNGCSLLPYALVHVGFEVTVVDISPVACKTVADFGPKITPEILARFLRRTSQEARPDGRLTIETADLLDWEPVEPFDLLYDDRCMQVLGPDNWPDAAQRYSRWLQTTGFCIVETVNLGGFMGDDVTPIRDPFEAAFKDAGFQQFRLYKSCPEPPSERFVDIVYGSG